MSSITPIQRGWLRTRWLLLQRAQTKADAASAAWTKQNDALNVWLAQMNITDPNQIDKTKGPNLELKGQMATWDFHRRDADRYATEILAFEAMKRMDAL